MPRKFKRIRFLPLAFIVGVEGFVLVGPYLILFLALILLLKMYQDRRSPLA